MFNWDQHWKLLDADKHQLCVRESISRSGLLIGQYCQATVHLSVNTTTNKHHRPVRIRGTHTNAQIWPWLYQSRQLTDLYDLLLAADLTLDNKYFEITKIHFHIHFNKRNQSTTKKMFQKSVLLKCIQNTSSSSMNLSKFDDFSLESKVRIKFLGENLKFKTIKVYFLRVVKEINRRRNEDIIKEVFWQS